MLRLLAFTTLLLIPACAQTEAGNTIAGKWDWIGGQALSVNADGSFEVYQAWRGARINDGHWVRLGSGQYQLTHRMGGYVDTVSLAADGNSLDGTNNSGQALHGARRSDAEATPSTPQQTAVEPWFGFAPYPGARQLCWNRKVLSEGVRPPGYKPVWGRMGTAAIFFTTGDALSKVRAFYMKADNNQDRKLSVHAASGESYPERQDCMRTPGPDQKTVIVVTGTVWGWL